MLVIEGRVFLDGELKNAAIGIKDGKIAEVKKVIKGDKNMDLGDRIILPGFVDPHVHFRDPGMTHKEDFISGSLSALYGGTTCVLDMPNTKPPVVNSNTLNDKKRIIKGRSFVDYGLFASLTAKCDPAALAPKVCGFKLFMGSTTGDILMNDDNAIQRMMYAVAPTGKRVSVHAEDNSLLKDMEEKSNRDHLRARPVAAEHNAINRLSRYKGMKVNICHITDPVSVATASSLGFTTEITMHHLFLHDMMSDSATIKVNPPLRDVNTRDALYRTFAEGKITMFGTDHAPHTTDEKNRSYDEAPPGIPGTEVYVPMMMDMVKKGKLPLELIVRMGATAPADAFGMNKGKIEVGRDADFAIFDMRNSRTIKAKHLHGKAGYTPYEGWDAVFPDMVMVRGEIQLKNGELCGEMIGDDLYE